MIRFESSNQFPCKKIIIIIPVLFEERHIKRFVPELGKLQKECGKDNVKIFFSFSSIEENYNGMGRSLGEKKSWEILEDIIFDQEFIKDFIFWKIFRCEVGRGAQINSAIEYVKEDVVLNDFDYILLIDVDSYLDERFFDGLKKILSEEKKWDLVQIPNYYFCHADKKQQFIINSLCMYHNYFIYSQELLYQNLSNWRPKFFSFWLTGNGLILSRDLIKKLSTYPYKQKLDDMALAFELNHFQITPEIAPFFIGVEEPSSIIDDVKQKSMWFSSYFEFYSMFRINFKRKIRVQSLRIAFIQRSINFIKWIIKPILIVYILVSPLLLSSWIGIALYLSYLLSVYYLDRKYCKLYGGKSFNENIKYYFSIVVAPIVYGASSWHFIYVKIKAHLFGSSIFYLTKR